jgi:hypothetical protein
MDTNIIHGDVEIQNFLQAKIDQGGIAAAVVQEALKGTEIPLSRQSYTPAVKKAQLGFDF